MKEICSQNICTGCGACANICPKNCITLINDNGFIVPRIDENICVDCYACEKVCPQNKQNDNGTSNIKYVYEASSTDESVLLRSTSGGIFSELARLILDDNGVVFGAVLNAENMTVYHTYAQTFDEISKFNGSKYIGSNVQDSLKKVKSFLKQGRKVLFSGTPCQIDGLRSFLGNDYPNLFTVDFVCHGVGSQDVFHLYLNQLENKYGGKVVDVKFRDKTKGYLQTSFCAEIKSVNQKKNCCFPFYDNPFGKLFAEGKINRLSCYTCKYASTKRVADITLADCTKDLNKYHKKYGRSLVLINSEKGVSLYKNIEKNVTQCEISVERAKQLQPHLNYPAPKHHSRDALIKDSNVISFDELMKKYYASDSFIKSKLKTVKAIIKNLIK